MYRSEAFDRFYFDDDRILNDDVESIAAIESNALVSDRKRHLTLELKRALRKLKTETLLISGLKQARTQGAMHLYREANNFFREWIAARRLLAPLCLCASVVHFRRHRHVSAARRSS